MSVATFEANPNSENEPWIERPAIEGLKFRIWHLMFFCLCAFGVIMVLICCCVKVRVPRTKQEIEADYKRKKITSKFRKRLKFISNQDMEAMNLMKGKVKFSGLIAPTLMLVNFSAERLYLEVPTAERAVQGFSTTGIQGVTNSFTTIGISETFSGLIAPTLMLVNFSAERLYLEVPTAERAVQGFSTTALEIIIEEDCKKEREEEPPYNSNVTNENENLVPVKSTYKSNFAKNVAHIMRIGNISVNKDFTKKV